MGRRAEEEVEAERNNNLRKLQPTLIGPGTRGGNSRGAGVGDLADSDRITGKPDVETCLLRASVSEWARI